MALSWPKHPLIYEINTWTWLHGLSAEYGQTITLANVPDDELDRLARWGFDAVWLMGVWERSPAGQQAAAHPDLQREYRRALPDYTPDDIAGSPYAVRRYVVDAHLGGDESLAALRTRLTARGLRLVLDFAPNHTALDHPWLTAHTDCFIQGTHKDLETHPDQFFQGPGDRVFAHGRDPFFPPWADTVQLNPFVPSCRALAIETLKAIGAQCDGIRCDMAMLVSNRIFSQTWGERAGRMPASDYWAEVIPAVRRQHPTLALIAEVYWDMEWELQQQGFNYTYDKRLYDRLTGEPTRAILDHLNVEKDYLARMVHFIENHDEPRATMALGPGRDLAAAVLVTTLPGAVLLHEGQMAGHQVRLPVQLGRRPAEITNKAVETFYRMLLDEVAQPVYRAGAWSLRECMPAWDPNPTCHNLIAYTWRQADQRRLVVVNYAATGSQGRIRLADFDLAGRAWRLHDRMHPGEVYDRDGDEMAGPGLYVDLKPWQAHIFEFEQGV